MRVSCFVQLANHSACCSWWKTASSRPLLHEIAFLNSSSGPNVSLVASSAAPLVLSRRFDYGWCRGDQNKSSEPVGSFLRAHSPSQCVLLTLFPSGHCAPVVLIYLSHIESQSILISQNQVLDLILLEPDLEGVEGASCFSLSGKNVILEQV